MPTYELALILKPFKRPEAITVVRRIANCVWAQKGLIRDIEFLGSRQLVTRMHQHGEGHFHGMHWLLRFDSPPTTLIELSAEILRDVDVMRHTTVKVPNEESQIYKAACLLEEESLPPAYRQDVKDLMTKGKKVNPTRQL